MQFAGRGCSVEAARGVGPTTRDPEQSLPRGAMVPNRRRVGSRRCRSQGGKLRRRSFFAVDACGSLLLGGWTRSNLG